MGCSCYANIPFNDIFIKISMKTSIVVDEEGVMTFSEEMLKEFGWGEGDSIEFICNGDSSFTMRKIDER